MLEKEVTQQEHSYKAKGVTDVGINKLSRLPKEAMMTTEGKIDQLNASLVLSGVDIVKVIKHQYDNDSMFKKIADHLEAYKNFEVNKEQGVIYMKKGK